MVSKNWYEKIMYYCNKIPCNLSTAGDMSRKFNREGSKDYWYNNNKRRKVFHMFRTVFTQGSLGAL